MLTGPPTYGVRLDPTKFVIDSAPMARAFFTTRIFARIMYFFSPSLGMRGGFGVAEAVPLMISSLAPRTALEISTDSTTESIRSSVALAAWTASVSSPVFSTQRRLSHALPDPTKMFMVLATGRTKNLSPTFGNTPSEMMPSNRDPNWSASYTRSPFTEL